ncbi:MAG: hypothetical protein J7L55_04720 [Desulfurococcales archaeon]|nr:hypothetical protein [Desulfurococcales archaeon]
MESKEREELVKWVEEKIAQIRSELNMWEELLRALKGEKDFPGEVLPSDVRVIAVEGNVLANVIEGDDFIRVIFTEGFPQDSALVKSFLLKMLEDNRKAGYIKKYEVVEKRGYIMELRLQGVTAPSKVLKELELSLMYVWKNMDEASA